ncbi:hypothetical protein [Crocinitomix catalasitica]|uniref:hypothetical protein n=1 Tax=Crocinitomix catalasitica TaxID=184607 RepID=UPI0004810137|nr:hypothetical protein [Crocinitomix catalasitica]
MERNIQLIWDFYGETAEKTADHHTKHLVEFMTREKLEYSDKGIRSNADLHCMAYLNVKESDVKVLRDSLKPHRAFVVKTKD